MTYQSNVSTNGCLRSSHGSEELFKLSSLGRNWRLVLLKRTDDIIKLFRGEDENQRADGTGGNWWGNMWKRSQCLGLWRNMNKLWLWHRSKIGIKWDVDLNSSWSGCGRRESNWEEKKKFSCFYPCLAIHHTKASVSLGMEDIDGVDLERILLIQGLTGTVQRITRLWQRIVEGKWRIIRNLKILWGQSNNSMLSSFCLYFSPHSSDRSVSFESIDEPFIWSNSIHVYSEIIIEHILKK